MEPDAKAFVLAQHGTVPIIITAPHGGLAHPFQMPVRTRGVTVLDTNTAELATELVTDLTNRLDGRSPYLVVAKFSRQYVDANRSRDEAYEVPVGKYLYDAYHGAITAAVQHISEHFDPAYHGAILIDIHGQGYSADTVYRGSRNGATLAGLIRAHGADSIVGPFGLLGSLSAAFTISPIDFEHRENSMFNGGYTVARYGPALSRIMHGPGGAVQLEFGMQQRSPGARRRQVAAQLASAISLYYYTYLDKH